MAFTHGLLTSILLDGHDISRFFKSANADATKDTHETTAFKSRSKTFIPGLKDGTASLEGMYDGGDEDGEGAGAEVLEGIFEAAAHTPFSYYATGDEAGKYGKGMHILKTALAVTSSTDDVVQCSAELQSSSGIERIRSLTGLDEKTSSGEGASIDNTLSTDDGAVAYLHVTDCSDDLDVIVQHSTDGTTWVDLITFPTVDEPGALRLQAPGTVNRYVRVAHTLAGSSATFQVGMGRHLPQIPS